MAQKRTEGDRAGRDPAVHVDLQGDHPVPHGPSRPRCAHQGGADVHEHHLQPGAAQRDLRADVPAGGQRAAPRHRRGVHRGR